MLAEDVIYIINANRNTLAKTSLVKKGCIVNLILQVSKLVDEIAFTDNVSIQELAQNHYEFLDVLKTLIEQLQWIITDECLSLLTEKINNLIEELNEPIFLQHQKSPIRRKEIHFKSDVDETEPLLDHCTKTGTKSVRVAPREGFEPSRPNDHRLTVVGDSRHKLPIVESAPYQISRKML